MIRRTAADRKAGRGAGTELVDTAWGKKPQTWSGNSVVFGMWGWSA